MARFTVMATWDDVPHLTQQMKDDLWAGIPPYQRDARTKGIPALGAGKIFPIPEDDIKCPDFMIPRMWPKCYAMDVGWNWTGAIWLARNPDTLTLYLYKCYKRSEAEPTVHAKAIKSAGAWIKGTIDPAAGGRSQADGKKLIDMYIAEGLKLYPANNAVEAGILTVWELLSSGQLKVFESCGDWFDEFRLYRRDEKGKVVKKNDHLIDPTRYGVMSGLELMTIEPVNKEKVRGPKYAGKGGWLS